MFLKEYPCIVSFLLTVLHLGADSKGKGGFTGFILADHAQNCPQAYTGELRPSTRAQIPKVTGALERSDLRHLFHSEGQ